MIKLELLDVWIRHCTSLWEYFRDIEDGEELYQEVEALLFYTIVLGQIPHAENIERTTLYILFDQAADPIRQLCVVQKAGNIFCEPSPISIKKKDKYKVARIDPIGTMMGGTPYIEVALSSDKFFLQPFDGSFQLGAAL